MNNDAPVKHADQGGKATQRFTALQQQLLCAAIHFFTRHIRSDKEVLQRMEGNQMFKLFFEVHYHSKTDLNPIFPESVHDCSCLHVCSFILSILHQGIFSVSAFIISVIYLSRFKESSHITLHACTWRPLFLTSLLVADKMWEDKPVRNSSLAKLFPVLSNIELNKMEAEFLLEISFNTLVKPDFFCSFCEKLLAENCNPEIERTVSISQYAETLQADHVENTPIQQTKKLPSEQVNTDAPAPKHSQKHHTSSEKLQLAPQSSRVHNPLVQANQSASDLSAVPPRAHSAGPASAAFQRSDSQPRVGGALNTLRGGAGNLTPPNKSAAAAAQPQRSNSANPLQKTRTHSFGRSDDGKGPARGPVPGPQCGQGLLRRSLPAKTQVGYAPLARAENSALGAASLGHLPQAPEPQSAQASSQARLAGASGFRSPPAAGGYAGVPRSRPEESSPRSGRSHQAPQPGSVSPLHMPCPSSGTTSGDHTPHHQAARANSQTRVASSGLSSRYAGQYQAPQVRSATPPVRHHGGARLGLAKAAQPPARGISPGLSDRHYASGSLSKATPSASGLGPARALSAPRVQPGSTQIAPSGPPSVRTHGGHVPSSPSRISPYMASAAHAPAPQHFGAQSPAFPASPSVRGSSPAPGFSYSGGYAGAMHTGRGPHAQASAMHRNASPTGGATYVQASSMHRNASPMGTALAGASYSGTPIGGLSTGGSQGRSPTPPPPPSVPPPLSVRQPRSSTPGVMKTLAASAQARSLNFAPGVLR